MIYVQETSAEACGARIRYFMELQGLSQKDMCDLTKISKYDMSRYYNGKVRPRLENALKISQALDVPFDRLFGGKVATYY